jgi:hypothetical protein
LKVASKEVSSHVEDLTQRVSALENAVVAQAPAVAQVSPPPAATGSTAVAPPKQKPKRDAHHTAAAAAPPAGPAVSQNAPHVINKHKDTPIETGSIDKKAKAKAAAKAGPVGVLLATGDSVDSLRLNWTILNDRHADSVKNLAPRYVVSGKASKKVYSLVAGPIATTDKARTLCREMTQKGLACEVSIYRGTAL